MTAKFIVFCGLVELKFPFSIPTFTSTFKKGYYSLLYKIRIFKISYGNYGFFGDNK